jgi:hypothetical protein
MRFYVKQPVQVIAIELVWRSAVVEKTREEGGQEYFISFDNYAKKYNDWYSEGMCFFEHF